MRKTKPWRPSKFWNNMRVTQHPVEDRCGWFTFDDAAQFAKADMRAYDDASPQIRDAAKETGRLW